MLSLNNQLGKVKREIRRYYAGVSSSDNNTGGVAITFDDAFIDEWYCLRTLLNSYDAKVTFFVSYFDLLKDDAITKLKTLRDDGHEIGFHGLKHMNAVKFIENQSVDAYMNEEIMPGIDMMSYHGLSPRNFSYPYGAHTPELDRYLLKHFDSVRGTIFTNSKTRISALDRVYYKHGDDKVIYGAGLDNSYGNTTHEIQCGLKRAYTRKETLILYAHRPSNDPGDYCTPVTKLEEVLVCAKKTGLRLCTIHNI